MLFINASLCWNMRRDYFTTKVQSGGNDTALAVLQMSFALVADEGGTVLGPVAVARDVTEQKEREKAVAQSSSGNEEQT